MERIAHRAVIADEHSLCRAGLATLFVDHVAVREVVHAINFSQMMAAIGLAPQSTMVAVNFSLPGLEGAAGLGRLRANYPLALLVVLADQHDRDVALEALGAGAHGYISKDAPTDEMIRAFELIRSGQIYVPAMVSDITIQRANVQASYGAPRDAALTNRQLEVLKLVSAGCSNKEIARSLKIAEGTVKVHITAAFRALGVRNRVSAAAALRVKSRNGHATPEVLRDLFPEPHRRLGDHDWPSSA